MLSRILSGTALSIGCILTVQTAEQALDVALEGMNAALAAPTAEVAAAMPSDCALPDLQPCPDLARYGDELPPDVDAYVA